MYIVLALVFGVAVAIFGYETYFEKKEKKIGQLIAPKLEELIEVSSMRIALKQKEENRMLSAEEKNKIFYDCCNEI